MSKSTRTPEHEESRAARRNEKRQAALAKSKRDRFAWLEAWGDTEPVRNGLVNW